MVTSKVSATSSHFPEGQADELYRSGFRYLRIQGGSRGNILGVRSVPKARAEITELTRRAYGMENGAPVRFGYSNRERSQANQVVDGRPPCWRSDGWRPGRSPPLRLWRNGREVQEHRCQLGGG